MESSYLKGRSIWGRVDSFLWILKILIHPNRPLPLKKTTTSCRSMHMWIYYAVQRKSKFRSGRSFALCTVPTISFHDQVFAEPDIDAVYLKHEAEERPRMSICGSKATKKTATSIATITQNPDCRSQCPWATTLWNGGISWQSFGILTLPRMILFNTNNLWSIRPFFSRWTTLVSLRLCELQVWDVGRIPEAGRDYRSRVSIKGVVTLKVQRVSGYQHAFTLSLNSPMLQSR